MMRKTGILICTNPSKFTKFIPQIKQGIDTTLYIQFVPKNRLTLSLKKDDPLSVIGGTKLSATMLQLYKNSVCLNMDVRVLLGTVGRNSPSKISTMKAVEVVYFDVDLTADAMDSFIKTRLGNISSNCQPIALVDETVESSPKIIDEEPTEDECNFVALGGTFDRLHVGHKMLLSEAALMTRKRILVGLTDVEMLKSKTLWELIQPYHEREANLRQFLEEVRPCLDICIVPLNDIYGPAKDNPELEVLVVSPETLKGGQKINEMRQINGLDPLKIHSIDLVNEEYRCWDVEEEKMSSSNGRLRLLGTLLKPPLKLDRPKLPYVIGLTGGIASGKTSVSLRLKKYGAAVVDADKVAHIVYQKSQPGYISIIQQLGEGVLDEKTKDIDRKKLGELIFNNKEKRELLNQIVWPLTRKRVEELIKQFSLEGEKVIIVEASLLIEADWDTFCNEVWACLVPVSEAIKRVQERNKLSLDQATARVNAQMSNLERVSKANVVFSTLWPSEYTDFQVEKAWKGLQERLPTSNS